MSKENYNKCLFIHFVKFANEEEVEVNFVWYLIINLKN